MNIRVNRIIENRALLREMILYGIIGVISASLDSGLYILFTRVLSVDEFTSNFISINCGISLSFFLNSFINFKKTDYILKRALRFFGIGYIGLILSMIILYIGISIFRINDIYVKLFSVVVVAIIQFVLNKYISFRDWHKTDPM